MGLPGLDLILHNLVAAAIGVILLMVLAQMAMAVLLRISQRVHASVFGPDHLAKSQTFRARVRRTTLIVVAIACMLVLAGAGVLSFMGVRSLSLVMGWFAHLGREDFIGAAVRVAYALGIATGAFLVHALARAGADALGHLAARSARLETNRELALEVVTRLRVALRMIILCIAAALTSRALGLPAGAHRAVVFAAEVLATFYGCRFAVVMAHLGVDLAFEMSGRLTKLESPLKYLGSLTHLKGITKRAIDYFVYVAAATWVADQLTPDTWFSRAGRVGMRIVAIFYASRVLIEVCLLFIHEIFLNKAADRPHAEIQQRKTLVPVAVGLLRYGIYFSAIIMVLREASIDPTPLLAGAGVLGVAVGFGAQAFFGDIVAGFFILFENVLLVGDIVTVSGVRGTVEEIDVRITKIRDEAGVLHAIPNGEVRKVANHSKVYVNAVVEVYVPYDQDLGRVRVLLTTVAEELLLEQTGVRMPVEIKVQELGPTHLMLRLIARTPPGRDHELAATLRARILEELRAAGIVSSHRDETVPLDSVKLQIARPAEPKEDSSPGAPRFLEPPGGTG